MWWLHQRPHLLGLRRVGFFEVPPASTTTWKSIFSFTNNHRQREV
uniref:Uncharacterized protein n=1 Tax=Rhizophora mucronata TaxID=61149 RepID=A0A2P2R0M7_RHIMU